MENSIAQCPRLLTHDSTFKVFDSAQEVDIVGSSQCDQKNRKMSIKVAQK